MCFLNQIFVRRSVQEGHAPSYRISWRSVEPLLSYDDLTVFQNGDGPPSWILKDLIFKSFSTV